MAQSTATYGFLGTRPRNNRIGYEPVYPFHPEGRAGPNREERMSQNKSGRSANAESTLVRPSLRSRRDQSR